MSVAKKSLLVIFLVLFIDQFVKIWIKTTMYYGEKIPVFGKWFFIHFVENNGMAFGIELGGEAGKLILSLFRIIAISAIGYYLYKLVKSNAPSGLILCISFVFAGAIGNMLDSAFYGMLFSESMIHGPVAEFMPETGGYSSFLHGRVVDMLYFPVIESSYPSWFPFVGGKEFTFFSPVFNLADTSITLGVSFLLIFQKSYFKELS